ncbi:MAG TPA: nucleoside triphosphate pyrophosphohydrolase [Steroidobacteraceae bacterium]|nr:nucleoside triphosphate pyrophosphohydrolase [Steroidobacteraceae bacterium]
MSSATPDQDAQAAREALTRLLQLMRRLRDPVQGCPWDRAQDFASIAPYTIEEAYEVAEAIAHEDPEAIRSELGDLLFQVVFHARLAEERGWFDFAAVAQGIHDKLVRRHPHVFDPAFVPGPAGLSGDWERHKAQERAQSGATGTLAGVPTALPALTRAAKLGRRAARVGFDWPDAAGARLKVDEELREIESALQAGEGEARVAEEMGDLLLAVTSWARQLGVDPEQSLRGANRRFETRFACMERLAAAQGRELAGLSLEEWEALWQQAKRTV